MSRVLDRFVAVPRFLPEHVFFVEFLLPLTTEKRMLPMKRSKRKQVADVMAAIACQCDV